MHKTLTPTEFNNDYDLHDWQYVGGVLQATFRGKTYRAAAELILKIADAAENAEHHPDIDLRYPGWVQVRLVTHEVSAVTTRDTDLAATISGLASPFVGS